MLIGRFELSIRHWTALIACAAGLVYFHTLGHQFAFDDFPEIVRNPHVRSLTCLPTVFTSMAWTGLSLDKQIYLYRPVTTVSYALNYAFTGLAPWSYHLVNTALHALVTVLFFRIALRWGLALNAAGLGALLFAVHPIHVEVVANVAGRKELLLAFFMLSALFAHSQALRRGGIWMGLAPIMFGAAMLSKETGAVTLGLFLLQDTLLERRRQGQAGRGSLPGLYTAHGLMLLAYLMVRWLVVGRFGVGDIEILDNPAAHASPWVRVMTATAVVGRGFGLLVAPVNLSPDYSYRAIPLVESPMNAGFLITVLVIVGLAVLAWALRRTQPIVPFAVGWYALTLLPAANLLFPIGTIFGERLLYVPSVAFCLMAGFLLAKGLPTLQPAIAALLVLGAVATLGLRTVTYAGVWKDDFSLFSAAARTVPNSSKVIANLGYTLMQQGRTAEAIKAYRRALSILPSNDRARLNLAGAYVQDNQLEKAEQMYHRLLEIMPNNADVLHGLGAIRRLQGRLVEAADFWSRALAVNPKHVRSLSDLGNIRFMAGKFETAQELYERAVAADPTIPHTTTWYNLGMVYERTGRWEQARAAWRRFLETAGDEYAEQVAEVRQKLSRTR